VLGLGTVSLLRIKTSLFFKVAPNYGQAGVLYNLIIKKAIKLNNRITIKTAATREYLISLKNPILRLRSSPQYMHLKASSSRMVSLQCGQIYSAT